MADLVVEAYVSWAWTAEHVAAVERSHSPLILPNTPAAEPALVHFSRMGTDGEQISWLWLFNDKAEAIALRTLPQFCQGSEIDLIEATIPDSKDVALTLVPSQWLRHIPDDIHEVWIGFDWRRYKMDRSLPFATRTRMSAEEFMGLVRRV